MIKIKYKDPLVVRLTYLLLLLFIWGYIIVANSDYLSSTYLLVILVTSTIALILRDLLKNISIFIDDKNRLCTIEFHSLNKKYVSTEFTTKKMSGQSLFGSLIIIYVGFIPLSLYKAGFKSEKEFKKIKAIE